MTIDIIIHELEEAVEHRVDADYYADKCVDRALEYLKMFKKETSEKKITLEELEEMLDRVNIRKIGRLKRSKL